MLAKKIERFYKFASFGATKRKHVLDVANSKSSWQGFGKDTVKEAEILRNRLSRAYYRSCDFKFLRFLIFCFLSEIVRRKMERITRVELATFSMATRRSTTELNPHLYGVFENIMIVLKSVK